MALVIAGERSGVGKTTVTLSILAALRHRNLSVQSFKVGPDYIDPMFHQAMTGRSPRNLDPVLTSEQYVQQSFSRHTQSVPYALIEGVMGLFDGATGTDDFASTAHIARLLDLPILLVLDCSRLSRSAAAIVHGYTTFDPRLKFAGVILNRVGSDRHLTLLKDALRTINLPILGVFHRQADITIPDRHLGLVPTAELPELNSLIDRLAHLGETCLNWSHLLPLLQSPLSSSPSPSPSPISHPPPPRIAVAFDRAFNFYYPDNLEQLEQQGAELIYWSPLVDELPDRMDGFYFGGGFPEVFAAELAENRSARHSVLSAIQSGTPVYAECGGLMYLCDRIIDFDEKSWSMVGAIPATAQMGKRLTLGYRKAIALQDTPLLKTGTTVWGHEFHRSTLLQEPPSPLYQIQGYDPHSLPGVEGWRSPNIHASYVHLHWGANPDIPARFLFHCRKRP